MRQIELVVGLLLCAIPLIAFARRVQLPYPIVLTIGGLGLGFLPGLRLDLNPDIVLLIFLPPLLYWESITAPTDAMRQNARWIWPLAIGLVIATTAAVAVAIHAIVPQLSWAAAFVLGAIVAPTDEIASAPVAERLGVPRHVIAIIEGESLLNDAGSLVIYAAAVAAVVSGQFSPGPAAVQFFGAAFGAVLIGLAAAGIAVALWRQFGDTQIQVVISATLPFLAYIPAVQLHCSGVLAVVAAGVVANRVTPVVIRPAARLQAVGWWETTSFLINVALFIVLGMQLNSVVTNAVRRHGWTELLVDAVVVNGVIIVVRFAWVLAQGAVPRGGRSVSKKPHASDPKHLAVTAMAGFRGTVSLAAALAIPLSTNAHTPFPERDLIVFITFSVILVTLVGGGLLMPFAVRALRIPASDEDRDELRLAIRASSAAALDAIASLQATGKLDRDRADEWRRRYERKRDRFGDGDRTDAVASDVEDSENATERAILSAERNALLDLRREGKIDNTILRRLQVSLDMQETQADRFAGDGSGITDSDSELTVDGEE